MKRRVVVTGVGLATPLGIGREPFWAALLRGDVGIRRVTSFDRSQFPSQIAGEVPAYRIADFVPKSYRKATKLMARDIELAVVAASTAFQDAGLKSRASTEKPEWDATRFGCNIGAGLISVDLNELTSAMVAAEIEGSLDLRLWGQSGMQGLTPLWLLKYLPNMLACHVTIIHGLEGPSNTIACGEASGHLAIGEAFRTIQRGNADLMICGGAETKVHPMGMMRQTLLGRLNSQSNEVPAASVRPFAPDGQGTAIAEGGGLLILEEYQHAVARRATIYSEVVGFAAGQDSHGLPGKTGRANGYEGAMRRALKDAAIDADAMSLIIPSGSGVAAQDAEELRALRSVFADDLRHIAVTTVKPQLGSLAAGTSVEAAVAVLSVHSNRIPGSPNVSSAVSGLNVAPSMRVAQLNYAMSTAWSVGGQSAALLFRKIVMGGL